MNISMNTAMDLNQIKNDAVQAQAAVVSIVDREEHLLERVAELEAMEQADRLEAATKVLLEADSLVEIHKVLKDQVNRVQKRIEKVREGLYGATLDEVREADNRFETDTFELEVKLNPPSVEVVDLAKVPKDWRSEPKPIPHWKKWSPDKNAIKKALVNGDKRSIAGVKLIRKSRLQINRK